MSHFTLYTNPRSRGRMVRWMLEECEATYEVVPVPYGEPMKSAAYLAVNPMGKVPALKVDDTVLTEALGICTWLAEQFPEKNLIPPAGHVERGEFYRWMCFALHLEYATPPWTAGSSFWTTIRNAAFPSAMATSTPPSTPCGNT